MSRNDETKKVNIMLNLERNKPTRKDTLRLLVSGVQKHFPSGSLVLAKQTFAVADLVALLQADIDATNAADQARATWLTQVGAQNASHQKVAPVIRALKSLVISQFGDTQDAGTALADFGLTPRKIAERSIATKAEVVDKGRATRVARHTMGKNQKKLVTGTVTPTAAAQAPSGSAPTPASSTASAPQGVASGGAAPHPT
jgi:type I site-specific restriction endonuclease